MGNGQGDTGRSSGTSNGPSAEDDPGGWKREGRDLLRAIAAGCIFGMPLLYTMEMWWHGLTLSEWKMLMLLGLILSSNFIFCLASGFREEATLTEALSESITSVGVGIVLSAVILALIGELNRDLAFSEMLGKILMEAVAVSIGVSFANSQITGRSRHEEQGGSNDGEETPEDPERMQLLDDLQDLGATLAGATLLAFSVAPTEEIIMIAARLSPWQCLLLLGMEILLCYIILFASGFDERVVYMKDSIFQKPWAETVMASATSLAVAGSLYLLLGFQGEANLPSLAAATVTLGLPAIVGGAAGRIIA